MLGGPVPLPWSGRFVDGVYFVHFLDAAVVHCLASGVMIATHDVERRTTLPLPVTGSVVRTVTQYSHYQQWPYRDDSSKPPEIPGEGLAEVGRYRAFAEVCVRVAKNHGEGCRPRSYLVLRIPTAEARSQCDLRKSSQGRVRPNRRRR